MGPPLGVTEAVAIVDLSNPDDAAVAKLIRQACTNVGFFYVVNHGVDEAVVKQLFSQSERFFSLPVEEKLKSLHNADYRGYMPYLDEIGDPQNQVKADLKEAFLIGAEISEDDVRSRIPFHGPNVWPSAVTLPDWRPSMENYRQELFKLAKRLIRLIGLALELEADFFDTPTRVDNPITVLRLNYYPAEKSDPDKGLFGGGAHSDFGMLTILATDNVPGLQICKEKDATVRVWTDVPPIKGGFIVNLGDLLERWSNDIFRSTLHRVVNPGLVRYSAAYFVNPNYNCVVDCIPTCKSDDKTAKYPPVITLEYLLQRHQDTRARNK